MVQPYYQIFPHAAAEPVMSLVLTQKSGKMPKGKYSFVEAYCTEKNCDCRQVTIFVITYKQKIKAVISFGFDPGKPQCGPFLDEFHEQSPAAEDLLGMFVYRINNDPDWLSGMYERYRKVRMHVDGKAYKGKPFPKPGSVVRVAQETPDIMEDFLAELKSKAPFMSRDNKPGRDGRDSGAFAANRFQTADLLTLIEEAAKAQKQGVDEMREIDLIIKERILKNEHGFDELAGLLPRLIPRNSREEDRFFGALGILRMLLENIRFDIERQRPDAEERMARLQDALARHVYNKDNDFGFCTHVTSTLLDSRVEILPVIREANREMFFGMGEEVATEAIPSITPSLGKMLRKAGCPTAFDAMESLLEMVVLLDPGVQIPLFRDLLDSRDSFVRDTAALMMFHPCEEVREGIADLLASGTVHSVSPETLRRLIISRNWFPAGMRKRIDEAITAARRARVDCARLASPPDCSIRASIIDGAGAQSFFILTGSGRKRNVGNILWKQGQGIVDSFVRQGDKKELAPIMEAFEGQMQLAEMAPWFLERLVCHALAVGNDHGKPPHPGLLRVAEMLGCDRWKAELIDPVKEMAVLREELQSTNPSLLSKDAVEEALDLSAEWPGYEEFADTWFEDDIAVDEVVLEGMKGKRRASEKKLVGALLDKVLEARRSIWLERLILMTLWLRAAENPPIPWHEMFHVTEKLASGAPLKAIPLMVAIAEISLDAAMERAEEEIW